MFDISQVSLQMAPFHRLFQYSVPLFQTNDIHKNFTHLSTVCLPSILYRNQIDILLLLGIFIAAFTLIKKGRLPNSYFYVLYILPALKEHVIERSLKLWSILPSSSRNWICLLHDCFKMYGSGKKRITMGAFCKGVELPVLMYNTYICNVYPGTLCTK